MPHPIRFSFFDASGACWRGTSHDEMFSGAGPMHMAGRSCRALLAEHVLGGDRLRCESRAAFLRRAVQEDPGQILFRREPPSPPLGAMDPFPECADWIHREGLGWSGISLDRQGAAFEAPLFAFWLAQALAALSAPPAMLLDAPPRAEPGAKASASARADLAWDWRQAPEPRMPMLLAGFAAASAPEGSEALASLSALCPAPLAAAIAAAGPAAFKKLASGDLALLSLFEAMEISSAAKAGAAPKPSARI